jgi:hypothetical protein
MGGGKLSVTLAESDQYSVVYSTTDAGGSFALQHGSACSTSRARSAHALCLSESLPRRGMSVAESTANSSR